MLRRPINSLSPRPGLLAAFPKLVGTESQHTFVETDSVRYLYQPLETLYLIMITTKQANIMDNLETLRLLGKLVRFFRLWRVDSAFCAYCIQLHVLYYRTFSLQIPEYCSGHSAEAITESVYEVRWRRTHWPSR